MVGMIGMSVGTASKVSAAEAHSAGNGTTISSMLMYCLASENLCRISLKVVVKDERTCVMYQKSSTSSLLDMRVRPNQG